MLCHCCMGSRNCLLYFQYVWGHGKLGQTLAVFLALAGGGNTSLDLIFPPVLLF